MRRTNALQDLLEDLSKIYNDGDRVDVEFTGETPHAKPNGTVAVATNVKDVYGRTLDKPDELRVIIDTLSHEIEHVRESDLNGKKRFMRQYPDAPKLAGLVMNVIEDHYIDHVRTQRFKGLAKACAFKMDAVMQNHQRRPRIDKLAPHEAAAEGFLQAGLAGYVKGYQDADDDVREFLAWAWQQFPRVRETETPDEREAIAHEVMARMMDFVPDKSGIEQFIDDMDLPIRVSGDVDPDDLDYMDPDDDENDRVDLNLPDHVEDVDTEGSGDASGAEEGTVTADEDPEVTLDGDGGDDDGVEIDGPGETDRVDSILADHDPTELRVVERE